MEGRASAIAWRWRWRGRGIGREGVRVDWSVLEQVIHLDDDEDDEDVDGEDR